MARKKGRSTKPTKSKRRPGISQSASASDSFDILIKELTARLKIDPADIQTRLDLAECYNANGLETEIPDLLLESQSGYPFKDKNLSGRFDRLLAIGYAHKRQLIEADKLLAPAIKNFPEALDLHYTSCYVKLSLNEYQSALEAGERYLELWDGVSDRPHPIGLNCHSHRHKSQLLNFMGGAHKELGDYEQAKTLYTLAIKADPVNQLSYLNQANLLISTGGQLEAKGVVESGLSKCSQVHELKMIAQMLKRDFSISACLMVKNEEAMLPACLDSIRSWVDEIVVVDTGSTDKTIAIAESYGAKVFHQPWEGSFSKHRNYTMEKATSDWILIIDADEQMVAEDIPLLLQVMAEPISEIISINVINVYGDRKNRSVFLPSVRLFKRELGVRYEGIVHNQIKTPDGVPSIRANVRLEHFGYDLSPEKMKQKFERSKALLLKQLDENPKHAFAHFNLGQLLRTGPDETVRERSEEVIVHATKAVEMTDPDITAERFIHLMALDQLAWSHFYLKEHIAASRFCVQALELKSDYLDPLILLGHISLDQGQLDTAEDRFHDYLEAQAAYDMTKERDSLIINHIDGRVVAWYALACISMLRGDCQTAIERFEMVLTLDDRYLEANAMLGQLHLRQNELEAAEKYLLTQIEYGAQSQDTFLWLGDLYLRLERSDQAEKSYRQALEIGLESERATDRLIRLFSDTDQLEKFANLIENHSIDMTADQARSISLAERLVAQGKHEQAILIYEGLVNGGEASGATLNDLGNCYYRLSNRDQAVNWYQQASERPDCPPVCFRNLAIVLVDLKRYPEARKELERYLAIEPEVVAEYQLAGEISIRLEDYAAAIGFLEKYLNRGRATPQVMHLISECYLLMGHKDAAILGYQRALSLEPGFEPSIERLKELKLSVEPV